MVFLSTWVNLSLLYSAVDSTRLLKTSMPAPSNSRLERVPVFTTSRLVTFSTANTVTLAAGLAPALAGVNVSAWIFSLSLSALSKVTTHECGVAPLTTRTSSAVPSEYLALASSVLMLVAVRSSVTPTATVSSCFALAIGVRSAATSGITVDWAVVPEADVDGGVAVAGPSFRPAS